MPPSGGLPRPSDADGAEGTGRCCQWWGARTAPETNGRFAQVTGSPVRKTPPVARRTVTRAVTGRAIRLCATGQRRRGRTGGATDTVGRDAIMEV